MIRAANAGDGGSMGSRKIQTASGESLIRWGYNPHRSECAAEASKLKHNKLGRVRAAILVGSHRRVQHLKHQRSDVSHLGNESQWLGGVEMKWLW